MLSFKDLKDRYSSNRIDSIFIDSPLVLNDDTLAVIDTADKNMLKLIHKRRLMGINTVAYISGYMRDLMDFPFKSLLLGGLGLGVLPHIVQDFCDEITVIESNRDIIEINKKIGHLNSNVDIINDDFISYKTEEKFDLIVMDIWYERVPPELIESLSNKYINNVKDGGMLYIPLAGVKIIK